MHCPENLFVSFILCTIYIFSEQRCGCCLRSAHTRLRNARERKRAHAKKRLSTAAVAKRRKSARQEVHSRIDLRCCCFSERERVSFYLCRPPPFCLLNKLLQRVECCGWNARFLLYTDAPCVAAESRERSDFANSVKQLLFHEMYSIFYLWMYKPKKNKFQLSTFLFYFY